MIGFIVKHSGEGLGKIRNVQDGRITVDFFIPPRTLTLVAISNGKKVLRRAHLPPQTVCESASGQCKIAKIILAPNKIEAHRYQVEFDNGLSIEVSEIDIVPSGEIPRSVSPLDALGELQIEGYGIFQKREALAEAWRTTVRGALGLRALLSSRIDLRPHQAYVAGTVLMDRLPRYLLADEVGLGKTIEAGIVIHDLLERKPTAKILILTPSTLTQQWLCELYAKFSGRVFRLLEFRHRSATAGIIPDRTIASFPAALKHSSKLLHIRWDMVVVDEVHNILGAIRLYSLIKKLSAAAPGCLLLSAIPAQHREEEYLRLLALLEPERYRPDEPMAKEHFKELYDRQIELGRKLSYISRRLAEFASGAESANPVLKKVAELAALPVLSEDETLSSLATKLDPSKLGFVEAVQALLHHVGDRYRISRRILRNRRSQLIDTQSDLQIIRRLNKLPHKPDQLELDAGEAVRRFLHGLRESKVSESVLLPLSKLLFHSLCEPYCLKSFVCLAASSVSELGELLEFEGQISYDGWEEYAESIWGAVGPILTRESINELQRIAEVWMAGTERSERTESLVKFLRARHRESPAQKFIIFAGFFGLAARLAEELEKEFPKKTMARFVWDMNIQAKEKEVNRFRSDSQCWLMVSDETGGEGRNFQFVDEIIHFDIPWHVSKIEQRIRRLDRLGRRHSEVCSNVCFAEGQAEDGLLRCYESGFQVFARSISGLEFALSNLEARIARTALSEGFDGLAMLVDEIKNGAEAERAGDDVQGMLDAASLERKSAEVFRRAQSTPERDIVLERAFVDYFRFIAGTSSVRFKGSGDYPEGIIEFRPDQLRELDGLLPPALAGTHADRTGTFRRQIAQEEPNLEFFSVGNEFFDAVCATLTNSSKGRIYAVECLAPARPLWCGFEFAYQAVGRRELLGNHPGLIKHLERVLAVRIEHVFISDTCQISEDGASLLNIRRSLKREDQKQTWWNFTSNNEKVQLLSDRYAVAGWESLVFQAEARARECARKRFSETLTTALEGEQVRIAEQIRQARVAKADGWEDEVAGLEALAQAIGGWEIELDMAGFLSVNGGITP